MDILVNNNSVVKTAERMLIDSESAQKKITNEIKQLEDSIGSKKIKIEQSESSLYGGKVTSPKELQDLQTEIASLRKAISQLEDELLSKMVELEQANEILKGSVATIEKAKAKFSENNAGLHGEMSKIQSKLEKLANERQVILAQVEPGKIEVYEKLRIKKNGIAVAEIVDNECNICGSKLTQAEWQAARAPSGLVFCTNCGRILYAA